MEYLVQKQNLNLTAHVPHNPIASPFPRRLFHSTSPHNNYATSTSHPPILQCSPTPTIHLLSPIHISTPSASSSSSVQNSLLSPTQHYPPPSTQLQKTPFIQPNNTLPTTTPIPLYSYTRTRPNTIQSKSEQVKSRHAHIHKSLLPSLHHLLSEL